LSIEEAFEDDKTELTAIVLGGFFFDGITASKIAGPESNPPISLPMSSKLALSSLTFFKHDEA
jgi:hypothetical protein